MLLQQPGGPPLQDQAEISQQLVDFHEICTDMCSTDNNSNLIIFVIWKGFYEILNCKIVITLTLSVTL